MSRRNNDFQTIRSEGGLLPPDLLRRVIEPAAGLDGIKPSDYGLPETERLNEVITQSWNRLRRHWVEFRSAASKILSGEPGTGLSNDKWSLPLLRELGFGLLPTGSGPEINGRIYPISRFFGPVPIHLIGFGVNLDKRAAGVVGAARGNPHGLVQEFLNNSSSHLWAIVSNGLRIRVLRDNQALSRQSFLEFDLETMFEGEVYSDFVLLWLMLHATRLVPRETDKPESCWLETWAKLAEKDGTRVLGDLRGGVERSLQILGEGFTSHPHNLDLREALRSGALTPIDLHGQLLRLVYRLIFLFVSEDRRLEGNPLLHPPDDSEEARIARDRYAVHFSTTRLRDMASKIKGSRHGDLWRQFQILVRALSGDDDSKEIRRSLALPALGSFLWDPSSTSALNDTDISNFDFLEAIRDLAFTQQGKLLRPVDYKNLGAEELGGVYESLLALTPQISGDGARFGFAEFAGNERKTSGSYYTPDSLVQCLLDSALDPVVEEAIKGKSAAEAEKAILALKVCDPAVGSGHFLVGAAHRLARHLARVRALAQDESEPSPPMYQHALRDVIGRCLYGVDINPMSAELCRVSLWLESMEPGKPLSFLDHHIRVGNSLLGTTPRLLAEGIPEDAINPSEGDDKNTFSQIKRRNKGERLDRERGQNYLFEQRIEHGDLTTEFAQLSSSSDESVADVAEKKRRYFALVSGAEYQNARLLADTWCAVFVWKKVDSELGKLCPTERDFRKVESHAGAGLLPPVREEVERLRDQYQFFHWHLVFPDVFHLPGKDGTPENEQTGWSGGFDVVLGNPPWEKINLKDEEFFAETHPKIANAPTKAARKQLLEQLKDDDSTGFAKYESAKDQADRISAFFRFSGYFPQTGVSRINLYSVFCETGLRLIARRGRLGMVLPSGIVTDDNNKELFFSLVERGRLVHAWDFENREGIFPDVDSRFKFCLFCSAGEHTKRIAPDFAFYLTSVEQLTDESRHFTLSVEELRKLNPTTNTCPTFRSKTEAEITKRIYLTVPAWSLHQSGDGWPGEPKTPFNMSNDSGLFVETRDLDQTSERIYLPLYEAKFVHQFNHRFASFQSAKSNGVIDSGDSDLDSPTFRVESRYWLDAATLAARFPARWFLVWRDITCATNERTSIAAIVPNYPCAHTLSLVESLSPLNALALVGCLNSMAYDFCARQKVSGTHLNHGIWKQLPILSPSVYSQPCPWANPLKSEITHQQFLLPRVLELTYTAWDLEPFARDCGYAGPPFRWDEARRYLLRTELDAAFFHLYGLNRDDTAYILDTFPIVKRKDEAKYGDYRTKLMILDIYDRMQEAIATGVPYQTMLNPPPADPSCCHPSREDT